MFWNMPYLETMRKNETLTATAEGYTFDGAGVVHDNGFPFFVPGLIEGETAQLAITAIRKGYGYARIVRLIKKSEHRVTPKCSVYKQCGGCQFLHMDEEEQHRFKEEKVKHCFLQNAHMDITPLPILSTKEQDRYRNKVQVPVQLNKGVVHMGFYRNRTNDIVEFDDCVVQTELSNEIVQSMKKWLNELRCANEFRHVLIRHAHVSGQVMICMIVRHYPFNNAEKLAEKIQKKFPQVKSIVAIVNRREDNVILDGKQILVSGSETIEEELLGRTFKISARSFFQINPYSTAVLYQTAIDYAELTGNETVIDLYCGTGTIGILAAKEAKQVYGIEIVEDAIKDAEKNAERNGVTNISFMAADANVGAQRLLKNKISPDVVIVDPPRKGCSTDTLNAILKMDPKRLVYVSCDPATLARDCRYMEDHGYHLEKVQPVDMFPGTLHIENVALMSRTHN